MQDLYKLNQDKSYRILLIHGLFTSSGFWLGYLKYLKNFNISLININYLKFMEDEDYQFHILNILSYNIYIFKFICFYKFLLKKTYFLINKSYDILLIKNLHLVHKIKIV